MMINLNNKHFRSAANSENGEVSDETIFRYKQQEDMIWAEYEGGSIRKGFLIGKIVDDHLEFTYQHLNEAGELMTGQCTSYPTLDDRGKLRLHESWQWTCKDHSRGESVLVEV